MFKIAALSTEYLLIPVSASQLGVAIDPTTQAVEVAATVPGVAPISGDWKAATWETDLTDVTRPVYSARLLIGPASGVLTLTAALWELHVRITDNPETVVRRASSVWVY